MFARIEGERLIRPQARFLDDPVLKIASVTQRLNRIAYLDHQEPHEVSRDDTRRLLDRVHLATGQLTVVTSDSIKTDAETTGGIERPSFRPPAPHSGAVALHAQSSELFFNRELSWLEFNQRVLDQARDATVPLLERVKFAGISAANLDEFFMVRVAGLLGQRAEQVQEIASADRMPPEEQLRRIAARTKRMFEDLSSALKDELLPELAAYGVTLVNPNDLDEAGRAFVSKHFETEVMPVLTPLAIDPGHPFPNVRNKALNLVAMLTGSHRQDATPAFAVVQVPSVLPRLVAVPSSAGETDTRAKFVLLDAVIAEYVGDLFPGFRCLGAWPFRVIRNFDLSVDEEEAEDLLETIAGEVRRRDRGNAVCLTVDAAIAPPAVEMLRRALSMDPRFVFFIQGPMSIPDLTAMSTHLREESALRDEPFTPQLPPPIRDADDDIFEIIAREDVLLHHPYESYDPVIQFIDQAATDPTVLAIKQTLYRTSGDSPIVKALMRAAEHGKQVTALIEIKARFDEENNIQFARRLEEAGVTVVYGLVGLKTHAKVALVVRREGKALRRYVHVGTGNYNPSTARMYTDLSFFTAKPDFAADASSLFNLLTSCTAPPVWEKFTVAPLGLHERILGLIEREAQNARAGRPARIIAKMNSLVDPDVIHALYRASQSGVKIELLIRGVCCLRPGLPGVSDLITVRSIVDRFLEHHRVFVFEAGGAREVYAASADWMPRNFHRRIEVMFPIEDERLKSRVLNLLQICLEDNVKASILLSDGSYEKVAHKEGEPELRSQKRFIDLAKDVAARADAREKRDRPFVVRPVRTRPTKGPEAATAEPPRESQPGIPRPPGEGRP